MSKTLTQIDAIVNAQSVAIVGASGSPGKVGRLFLDRYVEAGCREIYPINPRENEILGLKAYPRVKDIPHPVDLVHILLPPNAVLGAVRDCIDKGVKGIIITSASLGIPEEQEQEIVHLARERGIRILGPNCIGIYAPASHLPFPLGPSMQEGSIGIVSQSGSFADLVTKIATSYGVNFSKAISCGNEADLTATDLLEYLGDDPDTEVILAYLEGITDGPRFNRLLGRISGQKPVIVWKCGATEAGAKAAASHTGALAGSRDIWEAVLNRSGAIQVSSLEEALDCIYMFSTQPMPGGNRIAVATGPGGPAVGALDACIDMGLEAARLDPATRESIRKVIPPFGGSAENPVDLSIAAIEMPQMYGPVIDCLNGDDNVDMIIVIGLGGDRFCHTIIEACKKIQKPIAIAAIHPLDVIARDYKTLLSKNIPVYTDAGRCANALAKLSAYADFQRNRPGPPTGNLQ